MKAIIYAGIGLFSAASVYGVVDYYNTKSKGILDKMYKEETPSVTTKKETTPATLSTTVEITKPIPNTTTAVKKESKKLKLPVRRIKLDDFSRGRIVPDIVVIEEEIKVDSAAVKKENN